MDKYDPEQSTSILKDDAYIGVWWSKAGITCLDSKRIIESEKDKAKCLNQNKINYLQQLSIEPNDTAWIAAPLQ